MISYRVLILSTNTYLIAYIRKGVGETPASHEWADECSAMLILPRIFASLFQKVLVLSPLGPTPL